MTDNLGNQFRQDRDPRTGRWTVSTANTPKATEGRFPTYDELPVKITGAVPTELAYLTEPRGYDAAAHSHVLCSQRMSAADMYPAHAAGTGERLRPRTPEEINGDNGGRVFGQIKAEVMRDAAQELPSDVRHIFGA